MRCWMSLLFQVGPGIKLGYLFKQQFLIIVSRSLPPTLFFSLSLSPPIFLSFYPSLPLLTNTA